MKILFLSYKRLSYLILMSFFTLTAIILFYSVTRLIYGKSSTIFAMSSTVNTYKTLQVDVNGDGKKEIINIEVDEQKKEYKIEILNDGKKKFSLTPDPKIGTIGPYTPWWPLQITIADINMDKVPEIITQVAKTGGSPSYIFRWNGKSYERILSGFWEGICLIDVTGDRIPEVIIEERIPNFEYKYTIYSWIVSSYNKIDFKLDIEVRGYDKIKRLIGLLNSPFEQKYLSSDEFLKTNFTDEWLKKSNNLEYLNNFSKNIVGIQLQDYIGEEMKWGSDALPKSARFNLRYIAFRKFGTEIKSENYIAEIETERIDNYNYKIKSIIFKGQ